jgi:hypothetical protein
MEGFAIELGDRSFRIFLTGHGDKAKAFGAVGLAVDDDFHAGDLPRLSKKFSEIGLGHRKRKIADKEAGTGHWWFIQLTPMRHFLLRFGEGFGGFPETKKIEKLLGQR